MNPYKFDSNYSKYDPQHREVISTNSGFEHFRTGEVGYTISRPDPMYRRPFTQLGVHVFATDYIPFALKTLKGDPIKDAWLSQKGMQYFLADLIQKRVVCVNASIPSFRSCNIPTDFLHNTVYWAQPDAAPIAGDCTVSRPFITTPEEKQFIKETQLSAKMLLSSPIAMHSFTTYTASSIRNAMKHGVTPQQYALSLSSQSLKEAAANFRIARTDESYQYLTW